MPRKTFVAGEVLLAQDVNQFLMDQSVMNFASSAARSSAIPTPTEGMVSYLADTGSESPTSTIPQIEAYTGATWQTLYGLTLISKTSFSAVSSQSLDNVFTSTYQNYRVMVNIDSVSGSNVQLSLRLRASGTDVTTNYRSSRIFLSAASTVTGGQDPLGTDEFLISGANATGQGTTVGAIDLLYPQETKTSGYLTTAHNYTGVISQTQLIMGQLNNTTSYDGFTLLITSGTITGSVSVYGYRN
jgi:hypothetical protein